MTSWGASAGRIGRRRRIACLTGVLLLHALALRNVGAPDVVHAFNGEAARWPNARGTAGHASTPAIMLILPPWQPTNTSSPIDDEPSSAIDPQVGAEVDAPAQAGAADTVVARADATAGPASGGVPAATPAESSTAADAANEAARSAATGGGALVAARDGALPGLDHEYAGEDEVPSLALSSWPELNEALVLSNVPGQDAAHAADTTARRLRLTLHIDGTGRVARIEIADEAAWPTALIHTAREAIGAVTFTPATRHGRPVNCAVDYDATIDAGRLALAPVSARPPADASSR